MSNLHPQVACSFLEEMEKMAGIGGAAATLGALGGLIGAGTGYAKAKARGEDTTGALLGAAKGGLVGGALGGGVGAGAAGLSRALRGTPESAVNFSKYVAGQGRTAGTPWYQSMDRSISDFGKRQVHALTGHVPKGADRAEYLKGIGIGGRDPAGQLAFAQDRLRQLEATPAGGAWDKLKRWKAGKNVAAEKATLEAHNRLMQHEATSLPGFAKAMLDSKKRGDVLGASAAQAWHGGGTFGKAMLGMGAVGTGQAAFGAPGPGEEDMGRGERVARNVGLMAGVLLPGSIPLTGQLLGSEALSLGLGRLGKTFDRPRVVPPPPRMTHDPTDPVESTAHQMGPEVSMSPSAQGKSYGGGLA